MDEEKKKKKNKKKKGRQTKAGEDVSVDVGVSSLEHNHVDSIKQNHSNQVAGNLNVQTPIVVETNASLDRHHDDGVKIASLEEKIRQLQSENDSFIQREDIYYPDDPQAGLEKKIINLQNEKDYWLQKEVCLEEKLEQLSDEKASWILKANSMKDMIGKMNEENIRLQTQVKESEESRASFVQEKQHLMETISSLQSQLQHLEREASFSVSSTTEMTKHVFDHEDLNAQIEAGRVLVEKLIAENTQLVAKVNELYIELDRRSLRTAHSSTAGVKSGTATTAENVSEFNENIASGDRMESFETIQIGDRTSIATNGDTGIGVIPTIQIGDRTSTANNADTGIGVILTGDRTSITNNAENVSESDEKIASGERKESFETIQIGDGTSTANNADTGVSVITTIQIEGSPALYEAGQSEEIVQVPLDDNEIQENESPEALGAENVAVPLSDAPLIGAPFRLISFFAKYVSGADLVDKNTSNSSR